MTGTRTAPVITDCARCVHNSSLLVGVIYCEAKIALSNSLAVIAVFLLAYDRRFCEAFMSRSLSLFCPPELELLLLCSSNMLYLLYCFCICAVLLHSYPAVHISAPAACAALLLHVLCCSGKYLRGSECYTLVLSVWILGPFMCTSPPVFSALDL
jgi:hypothetical protein